MSATIGSWEILPFTSPLLPVHAILLPPVNGGNPKILFLSGSRAEGGGNCPDCSAVWDFTNGNSFYRPLTPLLSSGVPYDFFCCGHAYLPNGDIVISGGTLQSGPFLGLPTAAIFSTASQSWTLLPDMAHGRWYPSMIRLGNERILTIAGKDENGLINRVPEIYEPGVGWTGFPRPTVPFGNYESMFLLEDGKLFSAGRDGLKGRAFVSTLPSSFSQPIISKHIATVEQPAANQSACVVMLPPAQDQKFIYIGGFEQVVDVATNRVNTINLKDPVPTYTSAPPLHYARLHHQAVILPDRTIFVCGGTQVRQKKVHATRTAELYDPESNTWTDMAASTIPRLYHSVALLMPDGKVLMGGSNPSIPVFELRLEYYNPPYLFKGARPVIQSAPVEIGYGQTITIQTLEASNIKWAELIRPSSVTHSLDLDQRLIDLPFTVETDSLQATVTANPNLAPSGWYMLFIVDNNDVPSVASWVHLT